MKVLISTVVLSCNADSSFFWFSSSDFGQCQWVVKSFLLENSVRVGKNGMDIVCWNRFLSVTSSNKEWMSSGLYGRVRWIMMKGSRRQY